MAAPAHPEVTVKLTGHDGNGLLVIGRVSKALKTAGLEKEAAEFTEKAWRCKSYYALLHLAMQTVTVT